MKTVKYLLLGALMVGIGAPLMALDNKSTIDAISKVIKANPAGAKDQVKEVFKKNKKNAEVLVGIGQAYFEAKDTANAKHYANLAIKANKNYGQGYILLGDIEVLNDDGGAAAAWYQQAIYFDPKNPEGYFKYANIYRGRSPEEAVAKLNDLRAQRPDVAVDALAGRILYASNRMEQSLQYYDKVTDKSKLEDVDITNYATEAWMLQKRDKSLEMALYGLSRNPRKAAWNRLAFYNLTDMERTAEALKYADALFNASDSSKFTGFDYTYYGTALKNDKQYDKAIEMFNKAMEENKGNEELVNSNRKALSDLFLAKEDFDKATAYYEEYLKHAPKTTASDMAGLATIYMNLAAKQTGDQQKASFKKADDVYARLGEKFPANIDFANFMRARINSNLDPETKEGLAKPFYEAIVNSLASKTDRDKADNARLTEAYRYLGYYFLVKNDKATADGYWKKVLEIDPDNETAKQALGIK